MNDIVEKPWGSYELLYSTEKNWVKILTIKPLQQISLQKHSKRNEVWTIIQGQGIVTLDNENFLVKKHDTVFIPETVMHRIHNYKKDQDLIFCEVATGIPKEEDVFRYEDDYDRK